MEKQKIKTWNQLDSVTQAGLARIYMMHSIGNLNAESPRVKDAIAEIYQMGMRVARATEK